MKKLCILVSLAGALYAPTVQAGLVQLYNDTSNFSWMNAGEFRAVTTDHSLDGVLQFYGDNAKNVLNGGGFQTFCIEHNEYFTPGRGYTWSISPNAMYGGQPSGGDPISQGTAFLYSQFASGTWSLYNYTLGPGRVNSAHELQRAIWALENEDGGALSDAIKLALREEFGAASTEADWRIDNNGKYNVRALNLGTPGCVQDQLVMVPEPSTYIAAALLGFPVLVNGLRVWRKRRLR